ncbi:MAG: ribonuclease P protein component [Elusimicrobia bacterium]|nr:ribonuclease P protein component [Elusimicrobiota bacterium]
MGLSRLNRLTKSDNFAKIKKSKNCRKFLSGGFVFYICPNGKNVFHMAVVCSSKLGDACKRNRLKRLIHEVFRLNHTRLLQNADIIVIPQKEVMQTVNYRYIEKHFLGVFQKAGFLKMEPQMNADRHR